MGEGDTVLEVTNANLCCFQSELEQVYISLMLPHGLPLFTHIQQRSAYRSGHSL